MQAKGFHNVYRNIIMGIMSVTISHVNALHLFWDALVLEVAPPPPNTHLQCFECMYIVLGMVGTLFLLKFTHNL